MTASPQSCRVCILVKALPQPSKTYGETVCCAGVTAERAWKRLFPVRFRHLRGSSSFARWDWVKFKYRVPRSDRRAESCHVYEDSFAIDGKLALRERERLLDPLLRKSATDAMKRGESLALIRPRNPRFVYNPKTVGEIEREREAYRRAARQTSMLDRALAELDPTPYTFRFQFEDDSGRHDYRSGDWEAHAMFWRESQRNGEAEALRWMDGVFNDVFPRKGMVFAIGNQAKRPQTWQLLAVIRFDEVSQPELPL